MDFLATGGIVFLLVLAFGVLASAKVSTGIGSADVIRGRFVGLAALADARGEETE